MAKNSSWSRNQCKVYGLGRKTFFVLVSKLISGCASGTQLLSWGSIGALLQPPYVGLPRKTNCKGGMGHSHTLSPSLSQDTARELWTPAKAGATHYSSERSSRQLNEAVQLKIETLNWKQSAYLYRRNMYSCIY